MTKKARKGSQRAKRMVLISRSGMAHRVDTDTLPATAACKQRLAGGELMSPQKARYQVKRWCGRCYPEKRGA